MTKTQLISCFIVAGLAVGNQFGRAAEPPDRDRPMISPTEALSRLKEGNARFTAGNVQHPHESSDERAYIAKNSYENPGNDERAGGQTTGGTHEKSAPVRDHTQLFRFACAAR